MHAQPYFYLHPYGSLTHDGQHAADTVYVPHTSILPPGILAYKQRVLHCANFATEEQQRQHYLFSPRDHTTQHAALRIAHCAAMIHTSRYNATILGDVAAEVANATSYDRVIRAVRKRSKIDIEIAILAISIKDRHRRRIFPIFDADNRGEDRYLLRRSRSRSPTLR